VNFGGDDEGEKLVAEDQVNTCKRRGIVKRLCILRKEEVPAHKSPIYAFESPRLLLQCSSAVQATTCRANQANPSNTDKERNSARSLVTKAALVCSHYHTTYEFV
jgi:hypothetical protein